MTYTFLPLPNTTESPDETKHHLWQRLTVSQRCLLATDGSLTVLLAALTDQRIRAVVVSQEVFVEETAGHHPVLELEPGCEFLRRKVVLRTEETHENLIYAESDICLHRMSEPIRQQLLGGKDPIGLIFRQHRIELFRELVDWGESAASEGFAQYFSDQKMLVRQYKIVAERKPAMVVTEHFPVTSGPLL